VLSKRTTYCKYPDLSLHCTAQTHLSPCASTSWSYVVACSHNWFGSELVDLYFALRSQQAHRRHVRPTRRPVRSGAPVPTQHPATGGVAGRPGPRIPHRATRGRDVEAPRLRHVRHSHSTMTHSAHHTHRRHSSRARQHSFRTRDAHEDTAHTKGSTRAASGLWGSPPPPRHNRPPTKLTNRPTSRAARPRPRTLPHTCPLWTHRTTSTSHPAPLAGSHAPRHAATHCTHTPRSRKEGCHRLVSLRHFVHFVTSACRITWSAMNLLHRRMPNATALADFAMPRCPFTRGVHSRRARCALRRPATASVAGGERHEQLLVTDHLPVDDLDGVTRRQA